VVGTGVRRSELFQTISTAILVLVAVSLLGMRLFDRFEQRRRIRERTYAKVADPGAHLEGGIRIGSPDAILTVVEYADFECPVCKLAAPLLDSIVRESGGEVALLFKHYPLTFHSSARGAAGAAQCAAEQGSFEEYSAVLWQSVDRFAAAPWMQLAVASGVRDTSAFRRCLGSPRTLARIIADSSSAIGLDIRGTPTLVVGGTRVAGLPANRNELRELVDSELALAKRVKKGK